MPGNESRRMRRYRKHYERLYAEKFCENVCLRAALGRQPLSLREAIARGDVEACERWAKAGEEYVSGLQRDVECFGTRVKRLETEAEENNAELARAREVIVKVTAELDAADVPNDVRFNGFSSLPLSPSARIGHLATLSGDRDLLVKDLEREKARADKAEERVRVMCARAWLGRRACSVAMS